MIVASVVIAAFIFGAFVGSAVDRHLKIKHCEHPEHQLPSTTEHPFRPLHVPIDQESISFEEERAQLLKKCAEQSAEMSDLHRQLRDAKFKLTRLEMTRLERVIATETPIQAATTAQRAISAVNLHKPER